MIEVGFLKSFDSIFQIPKEYDFAVFLFDDNRRDFTFVVNMLTDLTAHTLQRMSPKTKKSNKSEQATPRKPSDQVGLFTGAPVL